jgi:hypothetical protein
VTLYDKVKARADEMGKSIMAVETEAEVANGTISGWKTGKPYAETLAKVARVLETTVDELLK